MVSAKLLVFACLIAAGSCGLLSAKVGASLNLGNFLGGILHDVVSAVGGVLGSLLGIKNPQNVNDVMCLGYDVGKGLTTIVKLDAELEVIGGLLQNMIGAATAIIGCGLYSGGSRCSYCTQGYGGMGPVIGYTREQIIQKYGVQNCRSQIQNYIDQQGGISQFSGSKLIVVQLALELANIVEVKANVTLGDYKRCLKNTFTGMGAVYYSYSNGDQETCDQLIGALVSKCNPFLRQANFGAFTDEEVSQIRIDIQVDINDGAAWSNKCQECQS